MSPSAMSPAWMEGSSSGRALFVPAQAAHARQVGDDQIAPDPEQWAADAVSLARLAPDVEVAHQRSIARRSPRDRVGRPARSRQAGVASVGRLAWTCSMARRISSRPDGSKS